MVVVDVLLVVDAQAITQMVFPYFLIAFLKTTSRSVMEGIR